MSLSDHTALPPVETIIVRGNAELIKSAVAQGKEYGARDERHRIARFLRDLANESSLQGAIALTGAADLIQRGRV